MTERPTVLFSLISRLRDVPLAFVDVETTGASAAWGDRVIEVGIVRIERGRIVRQYQQLINPQRRISAGVVALTGITPQMVADQPTFEQQLSTMLEVMRGAVVLGHNVRFDLSFLRKELRRCRLDLVETLQSAPVFDTVRIARRRFGRGGNGLQSLAPRLGIFPDTAHRALADAQTTAAVFERMMEPVGGWEMCLCDVMREQGGPMNLQPASARESLLPLELEEALEQRCTVRLEYLDARDNRTERIIKPLHVRRLHGELVLTAHCHLRNDRRHFKLERIVQMTRIPLEPSTPPPIPVGEGLFGKLEVRIAKAEENPISEIRNPNWEEPSAQSSPGVPGAGVKARDAHRKRLEAAVHTIDDQPIMFDLTAPVMPPLPTSHEDPAPETSRPPIGADAAPDRLASDDPRVVP